MEPSPKQSAASHPTVADVLLATALIGLLVVLVAPVTLLLNGSATDNWVGYATALSAGAMLLVILGTVAAVRGKSTAQGWLMGLAISVLTLGGIEVLLSGLLVLGYFLFRGGV
jgi:hypothetical protein